MGVRRDKHVRKLTTKEKEAAAMLLGGEYLSHANVIMVVQEATPAVRYCASRLIEISEHRARDRIRRRKTRKGPGGYHRR